MARKKYKRNKPSVKVKNRKGGMDIITTIYDGVGNVVDTIVESVSK